MVRWERTKIFVPRDGGGILTLPLTSCISLGKLFTFFTLLVFISEANTYTEQSGVKNKYNNIV